MKTIQYLYLFILFCLTKEANAQFSAGLRVSYGNAWEDYGNAIVPENAVTHIPAYQFSGLLNFEIGKVIGIGIEPGFVRRGAACIPEFVTFTSDRKIMCNYAEMPLILTAKTPISKGKFEIFGKAGYGMSYMVSGNEIFIDLTGARDPNVVPFNFKNPFGINVRRWDNGIYAGLGIGYNLSFGQIFLETNGYMGMRNVSEYSSSKSRNIHAGMGYKISL
ncbi:MAG: hypothetical protein ABJC12_11175 [Saprospiraceae bacterium]